MLRACWQLTGVSIFFKFGRIGRYQRLVAVHLGSNHLHDNVAVCPAHDHARCIGDKEFRPLVIIGPAFSASPEGDEISLLRSPVLLHPPWQ